MSDDDVLFAVYMPGNQRRPLDGDSVMLAELETRFVPIMTADTFEQVETLVRDLSMMILASAGEAPEKTSLDVHHIDITITNDAERIVEIGTEHDCASCRANTEQALQMLYDETCEYIICAKVHWCAGITADHSAN